MRKKRVHILISSLLVASILGTTMMGIILAQETHDVAVTEITPSPTSVKPGELVNVTVVVENQGAEDENFDVALHYDTTEIETKEVALATGANESLTFNWNTTNVKAGLYALTATASIVSGETETEDNTLVSPGRVRVYVSPYIGVAPHSIVDEAYTLDTVFNVSIYTNYNGSDVSGYELILYYNPLVLKGIEVINGDLINDTMFMTLGFDNEEGILNKTSNVLFDPNDPDLVTSGPGTLATVTFEVVGIGDSHINLETKTTATTKLTGLGGRAIIDDITPDLGHVLHGYFRNFMGPIVHDIAVVRVTPQQTLVEAGELLNVTVVVENQGTVPEKFDVEAYYDYNPNFPGYRRFGIETDVTLSAGANKSLVFTWNTTGVPAGNRTVTAVAKMALEEIETDDNELKSDQEVTVSELKEQPIPIELIIGVVVVIGVVIAVALLALRLRKKPAPG